MLLLLGLLLGLQALQVLSLPFGVRGAAGEDLTPTTPTLDFGVTLPVLPMLTLSFLLLVGVADFLVLVGVNCGDPTRDEPVLKALLTLEFLPLGVNPVVVGDPLADPTLLTLVFLNLAFVGVVVCFGETLLLSPEKEVEEFWLSVLVL
jgi:hypothetical protein